MFLSAASSVPFLFLGSAWVCLPAPVAWTLCERICFKAQGKGGMFAEKAVPLDRLPGVSGRTLPRADVWEIEIPPVPGEGPTCGPDV